MTPDKRRLRRMMPPLTVEGRRAIIMQGVAALGERDFLSFLKRHRIPSVGHATDHVRKYSAKFFREIFELSQNGFQDK